MNLSDLNLPAPIRDYSVAALAQLEPEGPFKPFVMVKAQSGGIPIWLNYYSALRLSTRTTAENQRQIRDAFMHRMSNRLNWGKPLPNQTLENWKALEIRKDEPIIHDANIFGLFELVRLYGASAFPANKGGEVFFIRVMYREHPLFGVWADSYEAAKDSVLKADKVIAQQCSELGFKHYPVELP